MPPRLSARCILRMELLIRLPLDTRVHLLCNLLDSVDAEHSAYADCAAMLSGFCKNTINTLFACLHACLTGSSALDLLTSSKNFSAISVQRSSAKLSTSVQAARLTAWRMVRRNVFCLRIAALNPILPFLMVGIFGATPLTALLTNPSTH